MCSNALLHLSLRTMAAAADAAAAAASSQSQTTLLSLCIHLRVHGHAAAQTSVPHGAQQSILSSRRYLVAEAYFLALRRSSPISSRFLLARKWVPNCSHRHGISCQNLMKLCVENCSKPLDRTLGHLFGQTVLRALPACSDWKQCLYFHIMSCRPCYTMHLLQNHMQLPVPNLGVMHGMG